MLIWNILERTAARVPDRVAMVFDGQEITYGRLAMDVERLAAGFHSLGLRPGDRIALALPVSMELVTACLAANRASLIVVSLPVDAPSSLYAFYFSEASPRAVVTNQAMLSLLPRASLETIANCILTDGQVQGCIRYSSLIVTQPCALPWFETYCQDPISILVFTSGTTGRPKAIAHTQARLVRRTENLCKAMMLTDQDTTLLVFSPLRTPSLVYQLLAMLKVGGTIVMANPPDSGAFWDIYAQVLPTYSLFMPAYARRLFEHPSAASADYSRLRFLLISGDNPGPELVRKVGQTTGKPLLNLYGLTETGLVAAHPVTGPLNAGSMGKPFEGVEMRLVDDDGRDVEPGITGRLLVRTQNWMAGYWNDTLRTHQATCTGWYDTQDLARMDNDGFYWFKGRASDVIVRNATNVASALVTDVLIEHPAIAEAILVGIPDAIAGQVPVAFYRLGQNADDPAEETLRAIVSARVDVESIPVAFYRIEQWPLTRGGKIDRAGLVALAQAKALAG